MLWTPLDRLCLLQLVFGANKQPMEKHVASKVWATIPDQLAEKLDKRAGVEGRSRSDLISYLLERSMESWTAPTPENAKQ